MLYTDKTLKPIYEGQAYCHPETGTNYPYNYPKLEIPGIVAVTETEAPVGSNLINLGFEISQDLVQVHLTREKSSEEIAAELISQARALLGNTDLVAIRCFKANVAFPQAWKDYVAALRGIVNGDSSSLPTQPAYPEGT